MNRGAISRGDVVFAAFKYTVYALLCWNVWLYFQEDFAASSQHFAAGLEWRNVIDAFAATIDTLAWVVLLLLFELETYVLPDRWLRGWLRVAMTAVRAVCYGFIVYAFSGYIGKFTLVTTLEPLATSACSLVGTSALAVESLDTYVPLDAVRCAAMGDAPLWRVRFTGIVGTAADMALLRQLALADVINSGTWLLVVTTLEAEVFAQHRRRLTRAMLIAVQWLLGGLYLTLFVCAVFWWLRGTFLDFWDAFLWLVAFVFIEMNVFQWQAETSRAASVMAPAELAG